MSVKAGTAVEDKVRQYLIAQGLKFVESNYHSHRGEIDLIFFDNEYLVFVEVRQRKSSAYGGALASVDYRKQQKLIKTAMIYLTHKNLHDKYPLRFDVVTVDGVGAQINWIKNAFGE